MDANVIRPASVSPRSRLLDSLLELRLTLSIKKITNKFISKSEFRLLVERTKEKAKDLLVSNAIDDLFKDLFVRKETSYEQEENSSSMSAGKRKVLTNLPVSSESTSSTNNSNI